MESVFIDQDSFNNEWIVIEEVTINVERLTGPRKKSLCTKKVNSV